MNSILICSKLCRISRRRRKGFYEEKKKCKAVFGTFLLAPAINTLLCVCMFVCKREKIAISLIFFLLSLTTHKHIHWSLQQKSRQRAFTVLLLLFRISISCCWWFFSPAPYIYKNTTYIFIKYHKKWKFSCTWRYGTIEKVYYFSDKYNI